MTARPKPYYQAVLCLNPSESLPCSQAPTAAVFYTSVLTKDSFGLSLANTHLREHFMNYLSISVFATLETR